MRLQFIPRDYRRNENYHNCCELRFKASRLQIKNQIYSCTLPFFYLHQNKDRAEGCDYPRRQSLRRREDPKSDGRRLA